MLKILNAREGRWRKKLFLAEKYNASVVSLTLNIPGPDKAGDISVKASGILAEELLGILAKNKVRVLFQERRITADGPELIVVVDSDPIDMKKLALSVEKNHIMGRLADIDVMDRSGKPVSRGDLGMEQRKCLICDRPAVECAVLNRHERSDVIKRAMEIMRSGLER